MSGSEDLVESYLRDVPEDEFYARLGEVRQAAGDRAVLRALHYYDENARVLERGAGYLTDEARVEDRIGGGHAEGLFEAWSNLYARFAVAMADADKGVYGDFWYPDVKAGAQGIKWIEKCVESADKGSAWVDYE